MSTRRNLFAGVAGVMAAWFTPATVAAAQARRRIDAPPPEHGKWKVTITQNRDQGRWEYSVSLVQKTPGVGSVMVMGMRDTHEQVVAAVADILTNTHSDQSLYEPGYWRLPPESRRVAGVFK